jgi:hypothetical protein
VEERLLSLQKLSSKGAPREEVFEEGCSGRASDVASSSALMTLGHCESDIQKMLAVAHGYSRV